jgi:adenosylcobinamide-GDP ribazoletransferase
VRESVAFLTRLPVSGGALSARSALWFPLVGAAVGAAVGGTVVALAEVLPPMLAAVLAVALELALTGALHVDGLADSADGLGGRDRERALAIMRDHALGAYGASALVIVLLAKTVALAEQGEVLAVIAAYGVSRAAALPLAASLPYARPAGAGQALDRLPPAIAVAGAALAAVVAVPAPETLAAGALVVAAVWWLARRRLGGVTGDVLGAAIELTATAALIATLGT